VKAAVIIWRYSMLDHAYAVIMAGGGGTRLWPLSRNDKPKQMLSLTGDRTLFQKAVDRLEGILPLDRIFVVTVENQASSLLRQCPQIPEDNFLLETAQRGTASVVGLAATVLQKRDPMSIMAVLTADHIIKNEERFRELLLTAFEAAEDDYLVTMGIQPSCPSTGYGYIQCGEPVGKYRQETLHHVVQFKEKPDEVLAAEYLVKGDHYWNSGMFIWKTSTILEQIKQLMPGLYGTLGMISKIWGEPEQVELFEPLWLSIKPESIDYGVMEKAKKVVVLLAEDLGWNDVGSWDSLFDVLNPDEEGNVFVGSSQIGISTHKTLVFSGENSKRLIVTIGVDNLIVVDTEDAVLICTRESAQGVKEVVEFLKKTGQNHLL
jgi:mannose-1-phosphate guanylyltransferase